MIQTGATSKSTLEGAIRRYFALGKVPYRASDDRITMRDGRSQLRRTAENLRKLELHKRGLGGEGGVGSKQMTGGTRRTARPRSELNIDGGGGGGEDEVN